MSLASIVGSSGKVPKLVDIIDIRIGTETHRVTNGISVFVFNNFDYEPATIEYSEVDNDGSVTAKTNEIKMELTEKALDFLKSSPPLVCNMKITKVHYAIPSNNSVIFDGQVKSVIISSIKQATFNLQSKADIFERKEPKIFHSPICQNRLFDRGCKLLRANFEVPINIESISLTSTGQMQISSNDLALYDDNYFFNGVARETTIGDRRSITFHQGNTIRLHMPFRNSVGESSTIFLVPGCNRRKSQDCSLKYNNTANFKGMVDIPDRNIAIHGLSGIGNKGINQ